LKGDFLKILTSRKGDKMNNQNNISRGLAGVAMAVTQDLIFLDHNDNHHIPEDRDPRTIYDEETYGRIDELYKKSITLQGWMKITSLRGRNTNKGKLSSTVGYLANGIFGVFETIGRGIAWGVVGNPLSSSIAKCVTQNSPTRREQYEKLKWELTVNTGLSLEAMEQSFASIPFNLVSHNANLEIAKEIKRNEVNEDMLFLAN
jgi:hypothetical protein